MPSWLNLKQGPEPDSLDLMLPSDLEEADSATVTLPPRPRNELADGFLEVLKGAGFSKTNSFAIEGRTRWRGATYAEGSFFLSGERNLRPDTDKERTRHQRMFGGALTFALSVAFGIYAVANPTFAALGFLALVFGGIGGGLWLVWEAQRPSFLSDVVFVYASPSGELVGNDMTPALGWNAVLGGAAICSTNWTAPKIGQGGRRVRSSRLAAGMPDVLQVVVATLSAESSLPTTGPSAAG